jgi:hypothetical protein
MGGVQRAGAIELTGLSSIKLFGCIVRGIVHAFVEEQHRKNKLPPKEAFAIFTSDANFGQ